MRILHKTNSKDGLVIRGTFFQLIPVKRPPAFLLIRRQKRATLARVVTVTAWE
jgi:hypothetical protein